MRTVTACVALLFGVGVVACASPPSNDDAATGDDQNVTSEASTTLSWCGRRTSFADPHDRSCGEGASSDGPKFGRIVGEADGCKVEITIRPLHRANGRIACDADYASMQDVASRGSGKRVPIELELTGECPGVRYAGHFGQDNCAAVQERPRAFVTYPSRETVDGDAIFIEAQGGSGSDYLNIVGVPSVIEKHGVGVTIEGRVDDLNLEKFSTLSFVPSRE